MLNFDNSRQLFMSSDLSLFETGHFSDAVLVCGNHAWNVHRSIICKRCAWFEKALTGPFLESETKTITLTDMAPEPIEVVLRYLYSGAIDNAAVQRCEGECILSTYIRLWSMADFFLMEPLKADILAAMEESLEENMKKMCNAKFLVDSPECQAIIQEFFHCVDTTYRELPHTQPCKKLLLDYCHAIRLNLYRSDQFIEMVSSYPELGPDLFMIALKGRQSKWAGDSKGDYRNFSVYTKCSDCSRKSKYANSWNIDPQASGENIRIMEVPWRCEFCVKETGYCWQGRESPAAQKEADGML
ncbi:hypothetical protein KVR01_012461 [Diaporthe batatas]|uniref:uncharacterized protein n=1 Tax=Diaporthe batatas TaxID=748121 RepID=UPI001D03FB37|nr:uncharacterized protein KVR01_012461 [Diaporthe batatas]KAG8157799.1 hypothetical protein KVR01_012461 [Diaporthe batatas]